MRLKVVQLRGSPNQSNSRSTYVVDADSGQPLAGVSTFKVEVGWAHTELTLVLVDPDVEIRDWREGDPTTKDIALQYRERAAGKGGDSE